MPVFSHYGNLEDSSARLSIPALVFAIVTPVIVIARMIGRKMYSGAIGMDDWIIFISMLCTEVVSIQMIIVCEWAFGKHIADITKYYPELIIKTNRVYFVAQILYKVSIGLTKISILLLYIRVFVRRGFTIVLWVWVGIVGAFTFSSVMSSIFQCTPIIYAINKKIPGGHCIDLTSFWYANATFNILSDIVIILLPIPVVKSLQLPTRSKIILCSVFAVGIFVCITSILRITTLNIATSHLDSTWNSIPSSMWTVIESNLGIICACLPALKRPLQTMFPSLFGRLRGKTNARSADGTSSGPSRAQGKYGMGSRYAGKSALGSEEEYLRSHASGWMKMEDRAGVELQSKVYGEDDEDRDISTEAKIEANVPGDADSQEWIVKGSGPEITKTTQVTVTYDNDKKQGEYKKWVWPLGTGKPEERP